MRKIFFLFNCIILLTINTSIAQQNKLTTKKGTAYISWGYNREAYSNSDIHFKNTSTANYDFVLVDAGAHDKPGFTDGLQQFLSNDLTIPQYNFHIGYLFNDKRNLGIELSWDHLKYVVNDNATMHIKGQINGNEIDKDTFVTPDFIHLQHTNGNNYLMLNLVKTHQLYKHKYVTLDLLGKVGAGPLVSYSISTILGDKNDGRFRIHGYVLGASIATRISFLKYLFIQPSFQYAFADYLSTELGKDAVGRATHSFSSYTFMVEGGFKYDVAFGKKIK
ncbi:MAG: hypothetical protein ACOYMA_06925 [Bacteroidia bacterium]